MSNTNLIFMKAYVTTENIQLRDVGNNGSKVCTFYVSNNVNSYKNERGEWVNNYNYFKCNAWNKVAERIANALQKGDHIYLQGELRSTSYERDVNGQKVKVYDTYILVTGFSSHPNLNTSYKEKGQNHQQHQEYHQEQDYHGQYMKDQGEYQGGYQGDYQQNISYEDLPY